MACGGNEAESRAWLIVRNPPRPDARPAMAPNKTITVLQT